MTGGLCLLSVLVLPVAAQAAPPADMAAAGQAVAQRWCASCHTVGAASESAGSDAAPTFRSIAQRRSPDYLRGFLANPHTPMREFHLSAQEIEEVTAYLGSLGP